MHHAIDCFRVSIIALITRSCKTRLVLIMLDLLCTRLSLNIINNYVVLFLIRYVVPTEYGYVALISPE